MDRKIYLLASLILGLSIVLASTIFGNYYLEARKVQSRTIKVVGSDSKKFESDTIKWDLTLQRWTSLDNLKGGYKSLDEDKDRFLNFIISKGFNLKDIELTPIQSYQTYNRDNSPSGYNLSQRVTLTSKRVDIVESIALEPLELTELGINFQYSNLNYYYSKIDKLKRELLSSATLNANQRAYEIIKNTDVKIGKLISARAGVFQITREFSTDVQSYGVYDTSAKNREIKVTLHALFAIED